MAYKPTGRPAGRPRKDGRPAGSTPGELDDEDDQDDTADELPRIVPAPGLGGLCGICYPDGWPVGATGLGCQHGSWTRLVTGIV